MPHAVPVSVRRSRVVLPTYEPHRPDPYPMFLEKRVYQGSSGRVYPLPCTDRIAERPVPRAWAAVWLENEYLRVLILPELGGRIHRILDKTNGYDLVYHQPVIKPALVGLAGPWCSGGIEFNWPQHHRPSTFLPADVAIEHGSDGAITVWLGEHDPMARMKGMHGVCLRPGRACVELRARAYNRTADPQTFLWWANVAVRAHEAYQSFFPPDVTAVADHARRATTAFPRSDGRYYGVDYGARGREGIPASEQPRQFVPPHCAGGEASAGAPPRYRPNDLSWYANIPVPTSYMAVGSSGDFVGGYDHRARAGLVHVASHHISPGKKQWTWGNHEFGYAWDRNLTEPDARGEFGPYLELMAGVYTDNQPDFSFLQPGETKAWSQFWYPIREIGPARKANAEGAVSLRMERGRLRVGVAVTSAQRRVTVRVERAGRAIGTWRRDLAPDRPGLFSLPARKGWTVGSVIVRVKAADGRELIVLEPLPKRPAVPPAAATEPPAPAKVGSADELYLIGVHLEQYRHATRRPEAYWREALRRDPGDARCNLALGRWHLRRGDWAEAERHLRASVERLTGRNANPVDGESHYQLGLCLRHRHFAAAAGVSGGGDLLTAAYAALYKATWNQAWQAAGFHALAEIDCLRGDWAAAHDHLDRAIRLNADNLRARDLKVVVLRRQGRSREAAALLAETLRLDPLDWWARHLAGRPLQCDNQVRLDLAHDCVRAGLFHDALAILAGAQSSAAERPDQSLGSMPLVHYTRAWIARLRGDPRPEVRSHLAAAARSRPEYCFPARLEEIAVLDHAIAANPRDARASFYLGNLLYDRRRHEEAMAAWGRSVRLDPRNAIAWRNLGIAEHNIRRDPVRSRRAYERALRADPSSARLRYERDQLGKRLGESPVTRWRALRRVPDLVAQRDDLSRVLRPLQPARTPARRAGRAGAATLPTVGGRRGASARSARAHAPGARPLRARPRRPSWRGGGIRAALAVPENLGESRHLLANPADVHYWLGRGLAAAGDREAARRHWTIAAEFRGDFQAMSVRTFSEMTYFSALALRELGRAAEARRLLRALLGYARRLAKTPATIDYFATSLPTMLLFDDDLAVRQRTTALLLEAQALLGLGQSAAGRARLRAVLRRDPSHALAADLLSSP